MKKNHLLATALLLTITLFCSGTLSAQWNQSATAIYPTTLTKNVGIGTSIPNQKFQINGGDGISLGFGDGNTYEGIGSKRSAGGNRWGLDFYTSGASRMSITNTGNVGIGTSNPIAKLQISQGNLHVDSGYGIEFGDQSSFLPSHSKIWENASNGSLIIRAGGAFGFWEGGPPPPPTPGFLELQGDVFVHCTGKSDASIFLGAPSSGESIKSRREGGNSYGLDFYTANQNRLSISNTGNVGIGTTNSTAKLSVKGNNVPTMELRNTTSDFARIRLANTNNGFWDIAGVVGATDIEDRLNFFHNAAGDALTITGTGFVGIGKTNPLFNLDVNGIIRCTALLQSSDRRYKANIKTIDSALSKILAMRGTSYDFAADQLSKGFPSGKQVGFIAQELNTVMPELVHKDANGMLAVNYTGVIPVLVEALKEQNELVSEKETRIATLEAQNNELQSRLTRIEAALGITSDRQSSDAKTEPLSTKISPNPSTGLVTVEIQNTAAAKSVVVNIMDANGREVATRTMNTGASSIQFDLSQFPAGMYVAQILADGKMVSSSKVQLVK